MSDRGQGWRRRLLPNEEFQDRIPVMFVRGLDFSPSALNQVSVNWLYIINPSEYMLNRVLGSVRVLVAHYRHGNWLWRHRAKARPSGEKT